MVSILTLRDLLPTNLAMRHSAIYRLTDNPVNIDVQKLVLKFHTICSSLIIKLVMLIWLGLILFFSIYVSNTTSAWYSNVHNSVLL